MDLANSTVWFAMAIVFITVVINNVSRGRKMPVCRKLLPPVVNGGSIIGGLHILVTKGFRDMIHDQYTKLGSVFTIRFFALKTTFLIGPEISGHFFHGMDSEVTFSDFLNFIGPIVGNDVSNGGVDATIRNYQIGFIQDSLKSWKLRSHVSPMVQEVEEYFSKWGQQGLVDLKLEFEQLLTLIVGRCLLGKAVREKMLGDVFTLFDQLFDNGLRLTSILFPYGPFPSNRRRDRARAKLSEIFTEIVQSRKLSKHVEDDVLQSFIDSKYNNGCSTTTADVVVLIISMVLAGKLPSSTTSMWTGAHLLTNTRFLTAAVEEQKQIIRKYGDRIDYDVLREMDILHRCIKEALRINPPTQMIFRKVQKSFTVRTKEGNEYEIPKGHTIVSPTQINSSIPYIYKSPDVYDPDRFGPGREEDKVGGKFSYTVFGGGRHSCPGEHFAYMQIKVIWTHLLRNFELRLESPFPDMDRSKITVEPKGKIMVRYMRRSLPSSKELVN